MTNALGKYKVMLEVSSKPQAQLIHSCDLPQQAPNLPEPQFLHQRSPTGPRRQSKCRSRPWEKVRTELGLVASARILAPRGQASPRPSTRAAQKSKETYVCFYSSWFLGSPGMACSSCLTHKVSDSLGPGGARESALLDIPERRQCRGSASQ